MFSYKKAFAAIAATMGIVMSCEKKVAEQTDYIGPSEITVSDGRMSPEVLLSLGRLSDPQLSPDGKLILFGVSYTDIAQNRSVRNLFVCNTEGGERVQLTRDGKSISNARWDADGISFIQGGQIWHAPLLGQGGAIKLGKRIKRSDVPSGVQGFSISPDGSKIIYISTVKGSVKTPVDSDPALDKAKAYVAEDLMYRHWDHWVTEIPHSYVAPWGKDGSIDHYKSIDILGGADVRFELPTEPFGGIEQLCWSPDNRRLAYSCRKAEGKQYAFSTNTDIFVLDTETEDCFAVTEGGGYDTDPIWSPDGSMLAWISMERDGYEADKQRVMVVDILKDGSFSPKRELTAGFKYNAADLRWSDDSKYLYFNALAEGLQAIYKIDATVGRYTEGLACYDVAPLAQRLTSEDLWFDFNTPFAVTEDGTLLTSYCSMDFPTELVRVCPEGKVSAITDENGHILSQIKKHETRQRMVKTVDGKDMLTWELLPPDFDPSKTYPAIEILLGGPQGTLSQGWSYRWNYALMASQGYVVILPNRRGTTAFGQEWTEQISGDYPGLNMQDYLSAAREFKAEPYIGKLAGCGASYGGYSVYYLAGVHGNTFDCFIAHAGIFDEKYMYYETEEMWFPNWDNGGLQEYSFTEGQTGPAGDGVTFGGMRQGGSPWSSLPKARNHYGKSPDVNVTTWHTPILCIHGGSDFRIPYDQGMAAFNCAQMMGVPSKLIIFPEENHWILQPQNALFWHRSYFDWLNTWCK